MQLHVPHTHFFNRAGCILLAIGMEPLHKELLLGMESLQGGCQLVSPLWQFLFGKYTLVPSPPLPTP